MTDPTFPVIVFENGNTDVLEITASEIAALVDKGAQVTCARCNDDVEYCPDIRPLVNARRRG